MWIRVLLHTLRTVVAAWIVVSAVFILSRSLPPLNRIESGETTSLTAPTMQAQAEQELRQRLGLDESTFYFSLRPWQWHGTANQYHHWLGALLQGRLGASYRDGRPVETLLREALTVTAPLMAIAAACVSIAAIALSVIATQHQRLRALLLVLLYGLDSSPPFVLGALLLLLFANPAALNWFPAYGLYIAPNGLGSLAEWEKFGRYLLLPILSLVLAALPTLMLPLDAALQQEGSQPYATTARAKGASVARKWWRHVLPNALLPFLTRLTDLLPSLLTGAVVVEVLFALPGTGRLVADAAAARDYPVVIGVVLVGVVTRLAAWILADVLQALADPRLRMSA